MCFIAGCLDSSVTKAAADPELPNSGVPNALPPLEPLDNTEETPRSNAVRPYVPPLKPARRPRPRPGRPVADNGAGTDGLAGVAYARGAASVADMESVGRADEAGLVSDGAVTDAAPAEPAAVADGDALADTGAKPDRSDSPPVGGAVVPPVGGAVVGAAPLGGATLGGTPLGAAPFGDAPVWGAPVGRAVVGGPVAEVELDPTAPPGMSRRRKVLTTVLTVVALALGVPVILMATRPTGRIALPLPPGIPAPLSSATPPVPTPSGGAPSSSTGNGRAPTNGDPAASGSPGPSGPTQVSAIGGGSASASPAKPEPAPARPLTASYATTGHTGLLGLAGYRGQVTISNPGTAAVSGWTVTISLPSGETVNDASGASYTQSGTTVTFRPSGTATVSAKGSVHFSFSVGGLLAGEPNGCAIDGRPCN